MRMIKMLSAAAAAGVLALGAATAANATIVNIDATTTGVDFTFAPGEYLIEWVGVADGGAFDAFNDHCPTGDCSSGWSDAFIAFEPPLGPNDSIDIFNTTAGFSSASAALSATQSASFINHVVVDRIAYKAVGVTFLAPIPQPWKVISTGETVHFLTPDSDQDQDRSNNVGGVSLRITAVPEPATWGLMLLGFGGLGAMLRKRRRPAGALA